MDSKRHWHNRTPRRRPTSSLHKLIPGAKKPPSRRQLGGRIRVTLPDGRQFSRTRLEDAVARRLAALGMAYEEQFRFDDNRDGRKTKDYRADFRLLAAPLLIECEGLVWDGKGGHNTAEGVAGDIAKYNRAAELGWTVLRCTQKRDGATTVAQVCELARRLCRVSAR